MRINLASVKWHGASDMHVVPTDLDVRYRDGIAPLVAQVGVNSVGPSVWDEQEVFQDIVFMEKDFLKAGNAQPRSSSM